MKKFFSVLVASIVCAVLFIAGVACGGSTLSDKPLTIANKPTNQTLALTHETATYQLELADYDNPVEWISTVERVATVSNQGLLTMHSAGVTEIIVKDGAMNKSDSFVLTVVDERGNNAFIITGLPQGNRMRVDDDPITLGYSYEGGATEVVWASSAPNVATVSASGVLTPVSKGVTAVSVTKADDSSVRTVVEVEIIGAEITALSIQNIPTYGVLLGKTYQLDVSCAPANCADYAIEWSVDDTDVAVVDQQGNFIAIATGECVLTAKAVGTNVQAQQTVSVQELSPYSEQFRYASVGTSTVFDVGPAIVFSNLDAEIIAYGEDFALLIKTRGNDAYNYFSIDFGVLPQGEYELKLRFDILQGEHDCTITREGESNAYKSLSDAQSLGDNMYSFTLAHNGGRAKYRFVNTDWTAVSQVAVDDVSIREIQRVEKVLVKTASTPITFDGAANGANAADYGVYTKVGTATVQDGKAVVTTDKVEQVVLALGDVTKGVYTLKFDAVTTGEYPAILQIVEDFKVYDTNEIAWGSLTTLYNASGKKLSDFAKPLGNTYEVKLSFDKDYKSVGLILINNENKSCGITLDNLSFAALDYTTAQTLADFENGLLASSLWSTKPGLINAANAHVDYQKTAGVLETADNNTYYKVTINANNTYSRMNLGWLSAGTYTFTFRAKASGANVNGGILFTPCSDDPTAPNTSLVNDGSKKQDVTFTGEWATYTYTVTLTKTTYIKLGVNRGAANTGDYTVCVDDFTVQKTA